jgi:hypothetical protein
VVSDLLQEHMKCLLSERDLANVKLEKYKFTWSNSRDEIGFLTTKLDRFLIKSYLF